MALSIIIIAICLALMVYQDLKFRHIHVLGPVVLFTAGLYIATQRFSGVYFKIIATNIAVLTFIFLIMVGYMSLKNKSVHNPFKNYFGLGDLLFYIAVSPLFIVQQYVVFFILSLLFSLLVYFIFKKLIKPDAIPLAGFASILLICIIGWDVFFAGPGITLIK